jgi:hypothetical protein
MAHFRMFFHKKNARQDFTNVKDNKETEKSGMFYSELFPIPDKLEKLP